MDMLPSTSSQKKPKSPGADMLPNPKTSVTCSNVPEGLFDATAAKKHFSKFGRVQRIRLFPKRHMCIIEYEQPMSAERAVLNAGAFDGFMFDVTRTKQRTRKKSKREDDPDWVPDSDVEEELSAMSGTPIYRLSRQKPMEVDPEKDKPKLIKRVITQNPKKTVVPRKSTMITQPSSGIESPVLVATTQTTISTLEAAAELHQLATKISLTPDEQWRILDARDRILRAWGGAGSRVKVGGATIGTCQDMCPEKELLHRLSEHQVMTLETMMDSEGQLEPSRAVKQYSRSSADQEIPMCYELRPAPVLLRTCSYLLHEIADTTRQISLADWFHFMWDRFRSIRKDIAQQALCCAESIRLVEMCARFHAHCAARLADLEHTQFDQKLNTDNLTKCLQTLKYMYSDVTPDQRPMEAEFRGYIALLNLGDANFWWEIKQLPQEIQKSEPITFAIQVFNALDNNNYVKFFRLVRERATYLQACILLRYFNDVRARALARIVKAYAPRGQYRFPAEDLMSTLAFESIESMKSFIVHYGLRFRIEENEPSIILSRNQFIEDSDPFPIARSIRLIESKRQCSVGEVIAGGCLPNPDYLQHALYSSFTKEGKLKETALIAEDQGFDTVNDSNKDVKALKAEIQRFSQSGRNQTTIDPAIEIKSGYQFVKPDPKDNSPIYKAQFNAPQTAIFGEKKVFSFKPAITVAPVEVLKSSPEKIFDADAKSIFSFSKPQESGAKLFTNSFTPSVFASNVKKSFDNRTVAAPKSAFENKVSQNANENKFAAVTVPNVFQNKADPMFKNPFDKKSEPSANLFENQSIPGNQNIFKNNTATDPKTVFGVNVAEKTETFQNAQSIFRSTKPESSLFSKPDVPKKVFEYKAAADTKSLFENKSSLDGQNANSAPVPNVFQTKTEAVLNNPFENKTVADPKTVFGGTVVEKKNIFQNSLFSKSDATKIIFGQNVTDQAVSNDTFTNNNTLTQNSGLMLNNNKNIFGGAQENSFFSKPESGIKLETGGNLFSKSVKESEPVEVQPNNLFAGINKGTESKNIFSKPDAPLFNTQKNSQSIFNSNGDQLPGKISPGSLFKSVLNPSNSTEAKSNLIFHSKNKAQTVADNILMSVNSKGNRDDYEFHENEEEQSSLEGNLKEERLLQIRKEEDKRQQELRRLEEMQRHEEMRHQNELRLQEELKRREEEKKRQEIMRLHEEKRKKEEQRKQEELRRKLEEERKAELKRKAEEEKKRFREAVEKESVLLVEEFIDEINNETSRHIIREEQEWLREIVNLARDTAERISTELCAEMCYSELKGEMFLTYKIMKKWFHVWKQKAFRNLKRRKLLEDTPVWLPERSPIEEACYLRRKVENSALKNMNSIHNGYKFSGELKVLPSPDPYKLVELIRSPLLKRMKEIQYPYDRCFFWKVSLVAPDDDKWLCKKINLHKWLMDAFSDNKKHEQSETLIHVEKESWNHLMDFAISVSLMNKKKMVNCVEAIEGSNGIIFYSTENDSNLTDTIQQTLKHKYPYQVIPVAVIMPKITQNSSVYDAIQNLLATCVENKIISGFKIFLLEPQNINELLNASTKKALKWLAKKYPQTPPLEIDYLKSICQRYLGNEIWCRFRTEKDSRMGEVLKDIYKLIECYNTAVERLINVITDEDLFNYASFPLEFTHYLDHLSPYPKSYEFIPSNVKTPENISTIKDMLRQLKLPNPSTGFKPLNVAGMQKQIRLYCNQIGWFKNPEEVVCKVVAVIPNEVIDLNITREDIPDVYAQYDLVDFLNIIVYEKIKGLNRFNDRFAIYEKSVLQDYRNMDWLYGLDILTNIKHKVIEYEDDIDSFIEAKRRKIALDSIEYLMLEDKDSTLVEENIKETDANITRYHDCSEAVEQLRKEIEEGTKKSIEFENMLRAALADV